MLDAIRMVNFTLGPSPVASAGNSSAEFLLNNPSTSIVGVSARRSSFQGKELRNPYEQHRSFSLIIATTLG